MRALSLARSLHGDTAVDLCEGCRALWFDAFESVTLTPGAILALFREVSRASGSSPRAVRATLACPRCRATLTPTQDLRHDTRFSYWRCPNAHGRFTPFVQFLREKAFVRPLAPAELARLKALVATVRCSGCGAPVDLGRDMVCSFCRAPLEVLDPRAVGQALETLDRARAAREKVDVDALVGAIRDGPPLSSVARDHLPTDLVGAGVELLVAAFAR